MSFVLDQGFERVTSAKPKKTNQWVSRHLGRGCCAANPGSAHSVSGADVPATEAGVSGGKSVWPTSGVDRRGDDASLEANATVATDAETTNVLVA
jgi:hypothetical protein